MPAKRASTQLIASVTLTSVCGEAGPVAGREFVCGRRCLATLGIQLLRRRVTDRRLSANGAAADRRADVPDHEFGASDEISHTKKSWHHVAMVTVMPSHDGSRVTAITSSRSRILLAKPRASGRSRDIAQQWGRL